MDFISSHVVMVVIVLGALSGQNVETGDEIKLSPRSSLQTTDEQQLQNAAF